MKIRGSIITASILALSVGGWILSGQLGDAPPTQAAERQTAAATKKERAPTAVRTRRIAAEEYASVILVTGQTEASRL